MNRMQEDYGTLLSLNPLAEFDIPPVDPGSALAPFDRAQESLSGPWHFTPDPYNTCLRKRFFEEKAEDAEGRPTPVDYDLDAWPTVQVPGCWNCADARYALYEGAAVYARAFDYAAQRPGERVFLRIGAANYVCRVFLNGRLLARHEGGFTPFCVELTDALRSHNRLILQVDNARDARQVPSLNYDWFNYGGLTREVSLLRVPARFIQDAFLALSPDSDERIDVRVRLSGARGGERVEVALPELDARVTLAVSPDGTACGQLSARPSLWSPDAPVLYDAVISCEGDRVRDRVGFRRIETRGRRILLNGEEIFLRGVCCHEEAPGKGRTLREEDARQAILDAKALGCNAMRLTHYPHSEQMARLADELGMLLWEEIPVYWAIDFSDPQTEACARRQLEELILRDRGRASVILWSVGNENPDTQERFDFMSGLVRLCRRLDPTRLTTAACLVNVDEMRVCDRLADVVDVVAFNEYYGWYYRDYAPLSEILQRTRTEKPLVISETGAGARAGLHGGDEELFTEEHQAKVYEKQLEIADGRLQGFFPWILYDFRSPIRLNAQQEGFNRKGLIADDRKARKLAFDVVRRYYKSKTTGAKG
ncbi:glycoside hydrolase family 2 TIM barrel-domain containing protein [Beduinella massiliensis]|uniref:glycoside hydrolase family 2 TIM barrel-domain containing protein n=1 Tax=Beduinella massiliensis TaxID=1852363 RepID=UPI000C83112E